jgi:type II secretory pathway component PulF
MPQFRYTARTKTGEELTGQLTAGDATWARRSLESAELEIISLERTDAPPAPPAPTGPASAGRAASPTESPTESPAPSPPPSTSPAKPQAAAPRLTTTQTQQLLGHLTATTASGLPIEDTLEALAAETDDRRLAETVRQLADRLRDGVPLDQAVVMLEKQLPPRIRGLLEVGVRCGDPAAVFEAFARQQLAARSVSRKIASTMAFPTIIFLITVPLLLFYALFLIPVFRDMFTEFDLELPALTVVAIKFGEAVTTILVVTMTILGVFWLISRLSAMSSLMCQFRAVVGRASGAGHVAGNPGRAANPTARVAGLRGQPARGPQPGTRLSQGEHSA